ncbi:hypothetical protein [Roseobacter weihaiensis]|uniref:hypothetical protein n=1 Tax=Roseobacter weihaiensis TaxID=2763262 RepID=UPI001D0BBA6F|nr:hypothetical protein [Roseobacter sp. H9]
MAKTVHGHHIGDAEVTLRLLPGEIDLALEGLDQLSQMVQFDADHGGSDEPEVSRAMLKQIGDLYQKLRAYQE